MSEQKMNENIDKERFNRILGIIAREFMRASEKFNKFNSAHEGFAVLLEEVDELWDEIKKRQTRNDRKRGMFNESVQVAAMAIRFLYDLDFPIV